MLNITTDKRVWKLKAASTTLAADWKKAISAARVSRPSLRGGAGASAAQTGPPGDAYESEEEGDDEDEEEDEEEEDEEVESVEYDGTASLEVVARSKNVVRVEYDLLSWKEERSVSQPRKPLDPAPWPACHRFGYLCAKRSQDKDGNDYIAIVNQYGTGAYSYVDGKRGGGQISVDTKGMVGSSKAVVRRASMRWFRRTRRPRTAEVSFAVSY